MKVSERHSIMTQNGSSQAPIYYGSLKGFRRNQVEQGSRLD